MQLTLHYTTEPTKQLSICYNQYMFDVGDSVVQASIITHLKLDQIGFRPALASLCHSIESCDGAFTTGAVNPGVQTRVCTVSYKDAA
jgi:hypothetical protein